MSLFSRTMHPDEANQAFTLGNMLQENGSYVYDPSDHHGPTLYYAAIPAARLSGAADFASLSEAPLRGTVAVFGLLTILFAFAAVRRLLHSAGKTLTLPLQLVSLLPLATLPIFLFYSTYFIQESLLGCFLSGMFMTGCFYLTSKRTALIAVFFGAFAALALATKETCAIHFLAAAIAAMPFAVCKPCTKTILRALPHALCAMVAFAVISAALYSSFFTNPHGIVDVLAAAPKTYLGRAFISSDHTHSWYWYLKLLFFTSSSLCPMTLAVATFFITKSFKPVPRPIVFLTVYSIIAFGCYSVIPYKTPWCMLTVAESIALTACLVLAWTLSSPRINQPLPRIIVALIAINVFINLFCDIRFSRNPDSPSIPFNYAAASPEVKKAASFITDLASSREDRDNVYVAVCTDGENTWPLPWYLRKIPTGYWDSIAEIPVNPAPVAVVAPATVNPSDVREHLSTLSCCETFKLREGVNFDIIYKTPLRRKQQ